MTRFNSTCGVAAKRSAWRSRVFAALLSPLISLLSPAAWSAERDQAYEAAAKAFFPQWNREQASQLPRYTRTEELVRTIENNPGDVLRNIATIATNRDAVMAGVETDSFNQIIQYLLSYSEIVLVQDFLYELEDYGDSLGYSKLYFYLAKYYEERGQWSEVQAQLEKIDLTQLSKANNDYALLMQGYVLQSLKKHRASLEIYERIGKDSPFFVHAKLNSGIASLRQGWWTEAHLEIETAIAQPSTDTTTRQLKNRARNTLAYSQMREGFYRDARETLRDIELDSPHANKGLMGLGLCATYQKDFVGALNAFAVLKKRPIKDLNVDESYLLVPYLYEQLDQLSTASVAYADAVTYFEHRILSLNNRKQQYLSAHADELGAMVESLGGMREQLYGLSAEVPEYLYYQYRLLQDMLEANVSSATQKKVQAAYSLVVGAIRQSATESLDTRLKILGSYAGQAKYGIAKLYDE